MGSIYVRVGGEDAAGALYAGGRTYGQLAGADLLALVLQVDLVRTLRPR